MTERDDRRRQVELSVVAGSALLLATSWGVVASGDPGAVQPEARAAARAVASHAASPASGLVPASPARRVVVVRRSRPS